MRHGRRHLLIDRHLFLNGPLHAHQADAELVFEQFADRAHPAIAQVVDVVDLADVAAQLERGAKLAAGNAAEWEEGQHGPA